MSELTPGRRKKNAEIISRKLAKLCNLPIRKRPVDIEAQKKVLRERGLL